MNQGPKTIIYPVNDLARAKAVFHKLLGVDPYADQPYYVGFRVADQEIGLDPNGHKAGATAYYQVPEINGSLQALVDAGAAIVQQVKDVGGGRLTAIARDAEGNIVGLIQSD